MAAFGRMKEEVGRQERIQMDRAAQGGAWIIVVTHRLNGTDLSWDELQGNHLLRYDMIPFGIAAT